MYIKDGIAYAGEPAPSIRVIDIHPMEPFKLKIEFNTGEIKLFDFSPLLSQPAFRPLSDSKVFQNVTISYGIPMWKDGEIDISPEHLYKNSVPIL